MRTAVAKTAVSETFKPIYETTFAASREALVLAFYP